MKKDWTALKFNRLTISVLQTQSVLVVLKPMPVFLFMPSYGLLALLNYRFNSFDLKAANYTHACSRHPYDFYLPWKMILNMMEKCCLEARGADLSEYSVFEPCLVYD